MKATSVFLPLVIVILSKVQAFGLFDPTTSNHQNPLFSSKSNNNNDMTKNTPKPTLVVGATGKVGRKVVQQLLDAGKPVRCLVRNHDKARELFFGSSGSSSSSSSSTPSQQELQLVVCDLGQVANSQDTKILNQAVQGCDSIISVSGCMRFSKLTDFLPWRLFQVDASQWTDDTSHPYYGNYIAQKLLIDMASQHSVSRFVRLTGLSTGFNPFSPFAILFASLLSMSSRYHFLLEQYLRNSNVPYLILRPGGLAEEDRDPQTTFLQVDPSGTLPPPARVPRSDVAALAAAACTDPSLLKSDYSYTLAIRAVGDMKPKPQGTKEDGYATASECLASIQNQPDTIDKTITNKPYGVAVAIFVYSLLAISLKLISVLFSVVWGLVVTTKN